MAPLEVINKYIKYSMELTLQMNFGTTDLSLLSAPCSRQWGKTNILYKPFWGWHTTLYIADIILYWSLETDKAPS